MLQRQHELERARADYHHAIRRLHAAGGSMREIAECLGLSHQRVHQIVEDGSPDSFLRRVFGRRRSDGGTRPYERFTERARHVIALAQDEARALGHNYLGTEHILPALLRVEDRLAARALGSPGLPGDAVRSEIERVVGDGAGGHAGQMPFTPRSKKVLELAVREARALDHDYVGTEHILLGLIRENEGVAAKILSELGADDERVRGALLKMLAG